MKPNTRAFNHRTTWLKAIRKKKMEGWLFRAHCIGAAYCYNNLHQYSKNKISLPSWIAAEENDDKDICIKDLKRQAAMDDDLKDFYDS